MIKVAKKAGLFFLFLLFGVASFGQTKLYKVILYNGTGLYEKATFTSTEVKHLDYGSYVQVLQKYGEWALAKAGDEEGYVYLRYLTEVRPHKAEARPGIYTGVTSYQQPSHYTRPDPTRYVYICLSPNAYAYHTNLYCRGLNRCRHKIIKVTEQEAIRRGYRPCRICH